MSTHYFETNQTIEALRTNRDNLRTQVAGLRDKIKTTEERIGKLTADIAALEDTSGDALASGGDEYARLQMQLRDQRELLRDAKEELRALKTNLIAVGENRAQADRKLSDALKSACRAQIPPVEAKATQLFQAIVDLTDEWTMEWERVFNEYTGSAFGGVDLFPRFKHDRYDPRFPHEIRMLKVEELHERMAKAKK